MSSSEPETAMDDSVPLADIEEQGDEQKPQLREDIVDGVESMNITEGIIKKEEKKDEPRPRLVIHSLVLDNFKSYGGTVKIGPFHKRFSSIVGPNGSGKSNVIDAMLFVFGRRAKQLRHSKMSELLHHSDTYPDVRTGTVTVNFREIIDTGDADDDYEVIKNSEFSVERRAFKNNTSKYYLNDKETQMKAVITLLKSKGVDLDNNRFLILQGEVEQIAMMKPKAVNAHEDGLLEYLEDIIGTNQYVEEIDTLSGQVETLNEERTHKLNRVKAVQKEREALEGAKTDAETLLEKEREFYNKKGIFIKSRINEHLRDLKEHTDVLEKAKAKLDESKKLFEEREKHVAGFDDEFNARKKTADHLRKKLNKALNDYAVFERRDIELREDLKALKAKSKKLDASLDRENGKKEKAEEGIEMHEKEVADAEKECKQIEKSLEKAESVLEKIHHQTREKTAPIRAKLEDKQKELMPFTDTINKCTQDVEVAKTELKLLLEERDAPAKELAEQEKVLEAVRSELDSANEKISAIQSEDKSVKHRMKELSQIEKDSTGDIAKNTEIVQGLQRKVAEFQQSSNDNSSRNRVQNGLHKAMNDGRITGVIGRLGDLASVDAKYDIAVGAAAGSRLDNIVVKSTDSAQACIHLLRRENLGRATFIILDKIQHLRKHIDGWQNSPNRSDGPRLFDYLKVKRKEHEIALYHVLGNTLVAGNMDDARRMAFKPSRKNKVVTVSGELIESSGAMSGGGRGPPRHRLGKGGNSFDVDPETMRNAMKELEKFRLLVNQSQQNLSSIQQERSSLSLKVEEIESNQRKTNMNIQSLKERFSSLKNTRIPDLKKAVMAAKKAEKGSEGKKIGKMEKNIAQLEKQVEDANKSCEGIQEAILQLQEKIVAAGGEKMQKAKESVESYREQLSAEKSKAAKAAAQIKEANKTMKKASDAITRITKQIEENSSKREAGKKEKRSLEEQAAEMVGTHDEAKEKYDAAMKLQTEAQEEYQKVKEELKAQRRDEVALKERFANAERNYKICKNEVKDGKKELNSTTRNVKRINDTIYGALGAETEENGEDESKENDEDGGEKMDVDGGDDDEFVDAMGKENAEKEKEEEDDIEVDQEDGGILTPAEKSRLVNEISALQNIVADKTADIRAIAEYKMKENECKMQEQELDRVTENRDEVRKSHDKLCKRRHDEFKSGFDEICKKLKELYQMITLGGDAELEFVDSMYPFTEGIVFSVRPPKKSWKNISNLSGGEKTLSSLALVFALHYYKPTPLYFLDEIDAALDFKNVSIVANYVKERTKDAQFIIISLRNNMFELADRLVGIYKTHHSTKSVTVNPKAFVIPPAGVPSTQVDTATR